MTSIKGNKFILASSILISIYAFLILMMNSGILVLDKTLSIALTIDLLLVVPFIYFLFIRKTNVPKTTVVPVMIIGLVLGSVFLPSENQTYLDYFKSWVLPVIEITVFLYISFTVRKAIKEYKKLNSSDLDVYTALKSVCSTIVPQKLVAPLAMELAVLHYAFISWRSKPLNENEYTYHKKNGTPALLYAFIFIIAIETFVFHILLSEWSTVVAWVLTGISIYSAIQIMAFAKSLSRRPMSIDDNKLNLRYGILNETLIRFEDIENIELSKSALDKDELVRKLSPLGDLEKHNIVITIKSRNTLFGVYGIEKQYETIALYLDEPLTFKEKVESKL